MDGGFGFLERLSSDVLDKISEYVHKKGCFRSWTKYWPNLCTSSSTWISPGRSVFVYGSSFGKKQLNKLVRNHASGLRSLDITSCHSLRDEDLASALCTTISLEELVLVDNCWLRGTDGFFQVLGRLPNLQVINASNCRNIDGCALKHLSQSSSIYKLVLDRCNISDDFFEYIPKQVTFLSVRMCRKITAKGLEILAQRKIPIQQLFLDQCSRIQTLDFFSSHVMWWSDNLFHLSIAFVFDLDDQNLLYVSQLRSLRHLKFSAGNVTTKGLFVLQRLLGLQHLTMLRLDRADLDALHYFSPRLETLYIYGCRGATQKGLQGILQLKNLMELVLCHNSTIKNLSFLVASPSLKKLRFLQISNFYNLSRSCILALDSFSNEKLTIIVTGTNTPVEYLGVRQASAYIC